jgi:hypothetical protein
MLLAFLAGVGWIVLVPALVIALFVTGVGMLAALALMLAYGLVLVCSVVFASYYLGTLALQKRATNALLVGVVGAAILGVLFTIPFINIFAVMVSVIVGAGMQVLHIKYQFSKDPYKIV